MNPTTKTRTISDDNPNYSPSPYIISKCRKGAYAKARRIRKTKCPKCGLFGCICQLSLSDWQNPKIEINKYKCPKCGLYLCVCPRSGNGEPL